MRDEEVLVWCCVVVVVSCVITNATRVQSRGWISNLIKPLTSTKHHIRESQKSAVKFKVSPDQARPAL